MGKRYIDVDMIEYGELWVPMLDGMIVHTKKLDGLYARQEGIENIPTADVEEVVRCKNCKYCEKVVDDFGVEKYFCVYFCGASETEQNGYCHRGRKNEQIH